MAQLSLSSGGQADAAAQSKFSITTTNGSTLAIQLMLTVGSIRALSNAATQRIVRLQGADDIALWMSRTGNDVQVLVGNGSQGVSTAICTFSINAISDSLFYVIGGRYTRAASGSDVFATVTRSDGTVITSGDLRLGNSSAGASSTIVVWNVTGAATIGGLAVFNGTPASTYLNPISDPNLVALYLCDDDGTGKMKDAVSSGTSLTVTSGSLTGTADTWDPSGSTVARSVFPFFLG